MITNLLCNEDDLNVQRELHEGVLLSAVTYGEETCGMRREETRDRCYVDEVFTEYVWGG